MEKKKKTLEEQLRETMDKINNRQPFEYDVNADKLYQQYKDAYTRQGALAQEDAIGKASAMTGGYGNSYAQQVGQQSYNEYMKELSDIVPSLYQSAIDQYVSEGETLNKQYESLIDQLGMTLDEDGNPVETPLEIDESILTKVSSIKANDDLASYLDSQVEKGTITEEQADQLYEENVDSNEAYSNGQINYKMMIQRGLNASKGAGWSLSEDGDMIAPDGSELSRKEWSKILQQLGVEKKDARKATKKLYEKLESLDK